MPPTLRKVELKTNKSAAHSLGIPEVIGNQRDQILRIAEQHKAYNVRVFGSVARGQASPTSDIDLLVDFQPDYGLIDHIGLKQALEDLLERRVDIAIEKNLRDEYRPSIMHDVIRL